MTETEVIRRVVRCSLLALGYTLAWGVAYLILGAVIGYGIGEDAA